MAIGLWYPGGVPGSETPAVQIRAIERIDADGRHQRDDRLVVEAPLELQSNGKSLLVTMRTPGHDTELAGGLLYTEGVFAATDRIEIKQDPDNANLCTVEMTAAQQAQFSRTLPPTSACGVCGKTAIADLELRTGVVRSALRVSAQSIAGLPGKLARCQPTFEATGSSHAAGLVPLAPAVGPQTPSDFTVVREDVGRHNAVDKVIGWAHRAGRLPLSDFGLVVSGRISFEIVAKAAVAGIPVVVAVSAPTSLAVETAERLRIALCGFTRGGGFNIYSHAHRII